MGIVMQPVMERIDFFEDIAQPAVAARIGAAHRTRNAVDVAVVALQVERVLNQRIGLQEDAQARVEQTPVHVDQAQLVQMLMAGEAAIGSVVNSRAVVDQQRAVEVIQAIGGSAFAERVIGITTGHCARVGGCGGAA